jgi:hypothetical protein
MELLIRQHLVMKERWAGRQTRKRTRENRKHGNKETKELKRVVREHTTCSEATIRR